MLDNQFLFHVIIAMVFWVFFASSALRIHRPGWIDSIYYRHLWKWRGADQTSRWWRTVDCSPDELVTSSPLYAWHGTITWQGLYIKRDQCWENPIIAEIGGPMGPCPDRQWAYVWSSCISLLAKSCYFWNAFKKREIEMYVSLWFSIHIDPIYT